MDNSCFLMGILCFSGVSCAIDGGNTEKVGILLFSRLASEPVTKQIKNITKKGTGKSTG